jgi:hypothetical protein
LLREGKEGRAGREHGSVVLDVHNFDTSLLMRELAGAPGCKEVILRGGFDVIASLFSSDQRFVLDGILIEEKALTISNAEAEFKDEFSKNLRTVESMEEN